MVHCEDITDDISYHTLSTKEKNHDLLLAQISSASTDNKLSTLIIQSYTKMHQDIIKYQYDLPSINESSRHLYSDKIYKGVVTLFQRYSDDSNKWTYGTCYRLHEVFSTGLITKTSFNHIQILIKNKFVITENKKIWLL